MQLYKICLKNALKWRSSVAEAFKQSVDLLKLNYEGNISRNERQNTTDCLCKKHIASLK